jgi:DNA polymerase elongation subunit (family B)
VAPNGIMYTKAHVRQGLLGRMLREILQTRVMVKQAMKGVKDDKVDPNVFKLHEYLHFRLYRLFAECLMQDSLG